jgi:hypothetical protein
MIYHNTLQRVSINPIVGIYFLFRKGELVYVGQSTDIMQRIQQHRTDKVFDSFAYKQCDRRSLNEIEANTIAYYKPEYNIIHNKEREQELPTEFQTEEFQKEFRLMTDCTARMFGSIFCAKVESKLIFSKVQRVSKKGYFNFKFVSLKGEFTGARSAMIKCQQGWFRRGVVYYYFKPSVLGFGWDIKHESLRK